MLSSWNRKEGINTLLRRSLSGVLAAVALVAPAVSHAGFTNSELWIGADASQIIQTRSVLEESMTAMYENQSLEKFGKELANQYGLRILTEASVADKKFELFTTDSSVEDVVSQVSALTKTFLVFRDGSLLFAERATFTGELSRELTVDELESLSDAFYNGDSLLKVGRSSFELQLHRGDYTRLRAVLTRLDVQLDIRNTDAVVFSGFTS